MYLTKRKARVILGLVLILLALLFNLQNMTPVRIRFLLFHFTVPRALLMTLSLMVGFIIGMITSLKKN